MLILACILAKGTTQSLTRFKRNEYDERHIDEFATSRDEAARQTWREMVDGDNCRGQFALPILHALRKSLTCHGFEKQVQDVS